MHLVIDARRVDEHARVMPHHHAAHVYFSRVAVDLHIRHPRRPRRTEAWPLAVDVAGVGKALTVQDVGRVLRRRRRIFWPRSASRIALRLTRGLPLLLWPRVRQPARLERGGAYQFGSARIALLIQVAQTVVHRVNARCRGQLINVRLMRKRVGQG